MVDMAKKKQPKSSKKPGTEKPTRYEDVSLDDVRKIQDGLRGLAAKADSLVKTMVGFNGVVSVDGGKKAKKELVPRMRRFLSRISDAYDELPAEAKVGSSSKPK